MRIPKKVVIEKLEGQTRSICFQSVLAPWHFGCLTIMMDIEMNVRTTNESWRRIHAYGFEDGRRATEIATAIRLMAAAGIDREMIWESALLPMDVKQAFGDVTLVTMSDTMTDSDIKAALAASILREQTVGRYDVCF